LRKILVGLPLAASIFCGGASSVRAADSDNRADAEGLFEAGREAMEAGGYPAACPKTRQSRELDPDVGTLLNLALCYKSQGRSASAWGAYRESAALARDSGQKESELLARKEAAALEAELLRFKIILSPELAAVGGVGVTRGDSELPSASWGVALPVDPGTIEVIVTAPGYESWST
jgi:tetratricopeptide (TPR) repeat protein